MEDSLTDLGGFGDLAGPALLAFPLLVLVLVLVLGLSGFETGVSMMPLVAADGTDDEQRLQARIRDTRKLLTVAPLTMSVYLLAASLVTTVLIPEDEFEPGGATNGRVLAWLAHEQLLTGMGRAGGPVTGGMGAGPPCSEGGAELFDVLLPWT